MTGRVGIETGLIDAIGGETEALAWLEAEHGVDTQTPVVTAWPVEAGELDWIGDLLGSSLRQMVGLPSEGIVMLDGLVSLWQVDQGP
jgi:protease IV